MGARAGSPSLAITNPCTSSARLAYIRSNCLGGGNYVQRSVTMAAAALASTPPLILYAIFQRRIIAGITLTGMGGR